MASPGSVVIQFKAKADQARRDVLDFARSLGKVDDEADNADSGMSGLDTSFDRVGDASRRAGDDLDTAGTEFDRLGDEAEDTADRLRIAANDMARGVDDGADGVARSTGRMKTEMGVTGREAGAEFVGNIAEGIGSGGGSLDDVVSGTLGGLTNLAGTLMGPVGIAAGVAAAGIGMVFNATRAKAEEAKERVDTLIGALEDLGETSSAEAKKQIFASWLEEMQAMPGELSRIQSGLETAGVKAETFTAAMTGNQDAQSEIVALLDEQAGKINTNLILTGKISEEDQQFLHDSRLIKDTMMEQNGALGTTTDYFSDLDWLTGKVKDNTGKGADNTAEGADAADRWAGNVDDVESAARDADAALDEAARPRSSTITVSYASNDSGWNPAAGNRATPGAVVAAAAPTFVTVNVEGATDPYSAARVISRQLQLYAKIQGRATHHTAPAW